MYLSQKKTLNINKNKNGYYFGVDGLIFNNVHSLQNVYRYKYGKELEFFKN